MSKIIQKHKDIDFALDNLIYAANDIYFGLDIFKDDSSDDDDILKPKYSRFAFYEGYSSDDEYIYTQI